MQVLADPPLFPIADGQDFLFQLFARSDIPGNDDEAIQAPGVVVDWKSALQHPPNGATGAYQAVLTRTTFARDGVPKELKHARLVLGVDGREPRTRILVQRFAGA